MKVYYWKGVFGQENNSSFCEKVIQQILAGDYQSAKLEKLTGHAVYSARINHTHRLLFTTIYKDDTPYLLVLEIVLNHQYKASKVLNNPLLLKYRIEQGTEALTEKLNEYSFQNAQSIPILFEPTHTPIEWIKTQWYGDQFILLTDAQGAVSQASLPVALYGVPGSGKSCVALALLEERIAQIKNQSNKPMLYITKSPKLLEKIKNTWEQMVINNQVVEFKTWSEVMLTINPSLNQMQLVDEVNFSEWLKTHITEYKKRRKLGQGITVQDELLHVQKHHAIYLECQLIMAFSDKEEDYYKLGKLECEFYCPEERRWLFQACCEYVSYLNGNKMLNPSFYIVDLSPYYQFIVVDESQDFPILQLKQLAQLALNKQIVYCIDTHQKIEDNPYIFSLLLQQVPIAKESRKELSVTFRSCKAVIDLANAVLEIQYRLTGGKTYKEEYTQVLCDKAMAQGEVVWINDINKEIKVKLQTAASSADFAVIIADNEDRIALEKSRNETMEFFNTGMVLTVTESKGLEFNTVVLSHLFNSTHFYEVNKLLEKELVTNNHSQDISKKSINRSKEKLKNNHLSKDLEQTYIAITRAKNSVIVVENNQPKLNTLFTTLKNANHSSSEIHSFQWEQAQVSSREQWLEKVTSFVKNGRKEAALGIFVTNLGGTVENFETFCNEITPKYPSTSQEITPVETNELKHCKSKNLTFFQKECSSSQIKSGQQSLKSANIQKGPVNSKQQKGKQQLSQPIHKPSPNKEQEYIAGLLKNFTLINLQNLFIKNSINKFLFNIKDKDNRCLFENIIFNVNLLKIFKEFLSTNTDCIKKISATKIWELFKNSITHRAPLFIELISVGHDDNDLLKMLIEHNPDFSKEIDLVFLQKYQLISIYAQTVSMDAHSVEKNNEKLFIHIECTPLFLLTFSASGRQAWMMLMNKNSEIMPAISNTCFFEYASMDAANDDQMTNHIKYYLGTIFNNFIHDNRWIGPLDNWITKNPSYAITISTHHLLFLSCAMKIESHCENKYSIKPEFKNAALPIAQLISSLEGIQLLTKIVALNRDLMVGIKAEALTFKYTDGTSFLHYLVHPIAISLFKHWVNTNPLELIRFPMDTLFCSKEGQVAPVFSLLTHHTGQEVLLALFKRNKSFAHMVTGESLCTIPSGVNIPTIPLFYLVFTTSGKNILFHLLNLNKALVYGIELESWCKNYAQNPQTNNWEAYDPNVHTSPSSALSKLVLSEDKKNQKIIDLLPIPIQSMGMVLKFTPSGFDETRPYDFGL